MLALFSLLDIDRGRVYTNALASGTEGNIRQYIDRQMELSRLTGGPLDGYCCDAFDELPASVRIASRSSDLVTRTT